MYQEYFGLQETPFSIAPDPRYLFMSEHHREALAHLVYGIRSEGAFVLLTGEVGTGKTTVCRCLLEQLPESCEIAYVLNPKVSTSELLATICDELRISYPENNESNKVFIDRINSYLLDRHASGRQTVLIIDEAQNLSTEVLEQLRLLTNLETNRRKLLQIILLGQPEFQEILQRSELRQLAQRITARYHLTPLTREETENYIHHRLKVAGSPRGGKDLFPPSILRQIFLLSCGIPRLINLLCDRALLGVYAREQKQVSRAIMNQAAAEIFGSPEKYLRKRWIRWSAAVSLVLGISLAAGAYIWRIPSVPPIVSAKKDLIPSPSTKEEVDGLQDSSAENLHWPEGIPRQNSISLAFEQLFSSWGITGVSLSNQDACELANTYRLRCLNDRGTLNTLALLDRPVVLTLFDEDGEEFHGTLTSLDQGMATLSIGGEQQNVPEEALEKHWLGEYALFWREPQGYPGPLRPGSEGPFVQWLNEKLVQVQGLETALPASAEYDENLRRAVKRFQLSHGLEPDGIVGSKTLIQLNSALDGSEPRLVQERG